MYRFFVDLLQPFTIAYAITCLALVNLWHKRTESRRRLLWLTIPFVVLSLVSMPAVAYLAIRTLEAGYPPATERPPGAAIVVLSGWAMRPDLVRHECLLGVDSQLRCLHAAALYRQGPPCLVVVTGGKVKTDDVGPPLGELMRDFLVQQGVPAKDIAVENQSRDTFENAQLTSQLLQQRGIGKIVLVTSATHLPRAVRCFATEGLDVTASGCDYLALDFNWALVSFIPSPEGAAAFHRAAHEWLGLLSYWVRGRI